MAVPSFLLPWYHYTHSCVDSPSDTSAVQTYFRCVTSQCGHFPPRVSGYWMCNKLLVWSRLVSWFPYTSYPLPQRDRRGKDLRSDWLFLGPMTHSEANDRSHTPVCSITLFVRKKYSRWRMSGRLSFFRVETLHSVTAGKLIVLCVFM